MCDEIMARFLQLYPFSFGIRMIYRQMIQV